MTLKPYPKYKPSGVEWLGDVPEHWEVKKLSYWISRYGSGTTPSLESHYSEEGIPWVTTGELRENVILSTVRSVTNIAVENISALTIHPKGSLLIAMYGATVGRVAVLGVHATLNQACFAIHPNAALTIEFLNYWFQGFRKDLIALATGAGQPNVSADKILSLLIPAPVFIEQTTIANFLDRETARIDTLIAKQQRMIELLKEKRQAVISHAVTKGLDPTVKMKESGVEWLGEIPEHWEAKRLKYNLSLQTEKAGINGQQVIALENIESRSGRYIPTDSEYSGEDVAFVAGDILFGKLRPYLAKVYLCESEGIAFGDLLTFRPVSEFNSRFAFYSMLSEAFIKTVDSSTYGTKMPRASAEFINEMPLATPPLSEQLEIAKHLDSQTSKFDSLIEKANQAIELLKERRTALISATVTGKIDVRVAA